MTWKFRTLAWICALPLASVATAQFTLSEDPAQKTESETAAVGGRTAFDLIPTKEGKYMFPLRFPHLIKGSERVDLDGEQLARDVDYSVDYESGVIYLKRQVTSAQSLRVQYRYDHTKESSGTFGMGFAGGLNNFMFRLSPNSQFVLGLGQTERLDDGTLVTSNVYGLQNSFKLGSNSTLSGVMMVGEREKAEANDLLGQSNKSNSDIEEGTGTAIVQELKTKALGGDVKVNIQDIDDKFNGFNSMREAGMDDKEVGMLQKERGLKRTGFAFNNFGGSSLNFNSAYNWVGDASGGVTWRKYGVNAFGVSANWESQYVDHGFNDFNKLREEDAKQLQKEKGLDRQAFSLNAPLGKDKALSFNNLTINTDDGQSLIRQNLSFDTGKFKGNFLDQRVEDGFTRFNDLREGDKKQLEKERGMNRVAWDLAADLGGLNLSAMNSRFNRDTDGILASGFGVQTKNWGFDYQVREVDENFNDFGSMTGDDHKAHITDVVSMYGPGVEQHKNDIKALGDLSGFKRTGWKFNYGIEGGWAARMQSIKIDNTTSGTQFDQINLAKGNTSLTVSMLNSDDSFSDFGRMLTTEQMILGRVDGLDKFDLGFATKFAGLNLNINHMNADSPLGGARRDLVSLSGNNFQFNMAKRKVDESFDNVGGMADSEAKVLSGLVGFDQSQVSGFWQMTPGLRFDYNEANAVSSIYDQVQMYREARLGWDLSKSTQLNVARVERSFTDGDDKMIDQQYDQMQVKHDFGKSGKVTVTQEQHQFNGADESLPDAIKRSVAYSTKISKSTDFATEQTETRFENGERETSSSNTVATKLNERIGVSVTDTQIRRDGDAPNETRRDYGFFVDFGSGIRLDYQYKRNMKGEDYGQQNTTTSLSGGQVGNVNIGGASYVHNRLDGQRNTHFGNVSLSNVNPFQWGALKDIKFHYSSDTQRDYVAWKKENLGMGLSAAYGQVGLGYDYSSQIHSNGFRAIDRVFTLKTDVNDKDRFRGTFKYGVRTMPDDDNVMIRDYQLTYDMNKHLSLQHGVVTNPAQEKKNVLLGSLPLDERRNTWTVKYQNDKRFAFDLNWNEIKRDRINESLRREARLNMTMLADTASPLQFSYALQQWDRNENRRLSHAFGLNYTQQPGPNQSFSFGFEHTNWVEGRPDSSTLRDWQFRLDYSLRF